MNGKVASCAYARLPASIFAQMQEQQRWDVIPGESWDALNTQLMRGLGRIHAAPDESRSGSARRRDRASGCPRRRCLPFAFNGADNGSITHLVMHGTQIKVDLLMTAPACKLHYMTEAVS